VTRRRMAGCGIVKLGESASTRIGSNYKLANWAIPT